MRLLELTQRFPPAIGGVETHVEALTREMIARGMDVEIATTDLVRDRPFERFRAPPVQSVGTVRRHRARQLFPAPHGLGIIAPGLLVDGLSARADVIHAHAFGYFPTWVGALRRRLGRSPLVISPHADRGAGTPSSRRYARGVARGTLRAADRVVALTATERRLLVELGVDEHRLSVIPNGIDLGEFDPSPLGSSIDLGSAPARLLFVGRVYPSQKGLLPLVHAFARLPRDTPAELRIVGEDWGGAEPVRAAARRLGISDRLVLLGGLPRAAVVREYCSADVVVVPSLFEPFGIVLLEAMAAGVPLVASDVGGIPDVVENERTGLLVPPGDVLALSTAIERLLRDAPLRRKLAVAAHERVQAYSWAALAPRWERLFRDVSDAP